MNATDITMFTQAVEAAGIDTYAIVSMGPTVYYNNKENAICAFDLENENVYNFRDNKAFGSVSYFEDSKLLAFVCPFDQICEFRLGADYDQMIKFIDSLGLNVTKDQKDLLLSIANRRRPLNPITGNYVFKELSEEEYAALTEDEKKAYDEALKEYQRKRHGMQARQLVIE